MRGPRRWSTPAALLCAVGLAALCGCGAGDASDAGGRGEGRRGGGGPGGRPGGPDGRPAAIAAVPVEIAPVERRTIASYLETNGTLEAEFEIDVVARTSAPVREILVEEGMRVERGQVLARLDLEELRAAFEVARVALNEADRAYERARRLWDERLISEADYEAARTAFERATAQLEENRIQLQYADVTAPFGGWILERWVDPGQQVASGTALFRLSDFEPLLAPIRVPERELPRLRVGQPAWLTVEAWPGERFEAEVLRVNPAVDPDTGTIRVTLGVDAGRRLRPGMFARVFLEMATREDSLVIPRAALALDTVGDVVFVVGENGTADRREVRLGFRQGDSVEVLEGVAAGERVVVVGQDGLSQGTPVQVL